MPDFPNPFSPPTQPTPQQRSKYLTHALDQLRASSQNIRSPGELGARLMADALLKWGRDRADKAAAAAATDGALAYPAGAVQPQFDSSLAAPILTPNALPGTGFAGSQGLGSPRSVTFRAQ